MNYVNARTPELTMILRDVLSALSGTASFCVLRNFEELPDYTTHDVDVLVNPSDLGRAAAAAREAGRRSGWLLAAEVRQTAVHSLYFYCASRDAVQCVTFDFVSDLPWGWLPTCNIDHIHRSAVRHRDIPVAAPGVDAALRLIKELVRRRPVKPPARAAIREKLANDEDNFRLTFADRISDATITALIGLIRSDDFEELLNRSTVVRRQLFGAACHRPLRQAARCAVYLAGRLRRFRSGSLGALVVMAGPDGIGKTTLGNRLANGIGESLFRGSVVFHSQFGFLPRLRGMARRATGLAFQEPDFTRRHSGSEVNPHPPWRTLLYLMYYSWDYLLGRILVWRLKGHSRLILFDRYFYDYYYQPAYAAIPRRWLDVFRTLVPRPDVVLLLTADVENVYARKPELTREEIRRQLDATVDLAHRLGCGTRVVTIRTDSGEAAAERMAAAGILDAVRRRNYGGA